MHPNLNLVTDHTCLSWEYPSRTMPYIVINNNGTPKYFDMNLQINQLGEIYFMGPNLIYGRYGI
jgi:hypothetical protein